jgi:hypothetical protein
MANNWDQKSKFRAMRWLVPTSLTTLSIGFLLFIQNRTLSPVHIDPKASAPIGSKIGGTSEQYIPPVDGEAPMAAAGMQSMKRVTVTTPLRNDPVELSRDPSSTASLSDEVRVRIPEPLKSPFSDYEIALEGAASTLYSQEQILKKKTNPVTFMAGIRWQARAGPHGIEGSNS